MVQRVERVAANLEAVAFLESEVFDQREIEVGKTRSFDGVAPEIAKGPARGGLIVEHSGILQVADEGRVAVRGGSETGLHRSVDARAHGGGAGDGAVAGEESEWTAALQREDAGQLPAGFQLIPMER